MFAMYFFMIRTQVHESVVYKLGALLFSVGHKVKIHKITSATGKERGDIETRDHVVLQFSTLLVILLTQDVQMVLLSLTVLSRKYLGTKFDTIVKFTLLNQIQSLS